MKISKCLVRNTNSIVLMLCIVVFSCSKKPPTNNRVFSHSIASIKFTPIDPTIHDGGPAMISLSLLIDKKETSNYVNGKYQFVEIIGDSILSSELIIREIDSISDTTNKAYILLLQDRKGTFDPSKQNYFVLFTSKKHYEIFEVTSETIILFPRKKNNVQSQTSK